MNRKRMLRAAGAAVLGFSLLLSSCGGSGTADSGSAGSGDSSKEAASAGSSDEESGGVPETTASAESQREKTHAVTELLPVDMTKWKYNAEDDVYWQVGISYCEHPEDETYETMGFFVPGGYFDAEENGDGTYTCSVNAMNQVGNYTADEAPVILPVNTPGYMAMEAPADYDSSFGYGSVKDYTDQGMVIAFAGCRGREQGAPYGVTDLKAAIRYLRYNAGLIPGAEADVYSVGMSGGGAQSAILGASGDSDLYTPYLKEIGAVEGVSDAVQGSMCWCPVTSLDYADEAYEWNLGSTRTDLSEEEKRYSDGMAEAFAGYLNDLDLKDGEGNPLTLEKSDTGIYQAGSYYNYLAGVVETSLNNFLADTKFPYDADSAKEKGDGGNGGPGAGAFPGDAAAGGAAAGGAAADGAAAGGGAPAAGQTEYEQRDNIQRNAVSGAVTISGTYETAEDYIAALNGPFHWVDYDASAGTVKITSLSDFCRAMKPASKGIGAFDSLDKSQGENTLFGYGDGNGAHFDPVLGDLVQGTEYEESFKEDLSSPDALGNKAEVRVNMYSPLYYLCESCGGYGKSKVADHWRIRTGICQSDTALCTEVNLALALAGGGPGRDVDFATIWGLGHTMAEETGNSTENFINWVNQCEGF